MTFCVYNNIPWLAPGSIISHWYPTACAAVYQCYLCIFLIAETDMIAARIIYYKMEADSFMNRG